MQNRYYFSGFPVDNADGLGLDPDPDVGPGTDPVLGAVARGAVARGAVARGAVVRGAVVRGAVVIGAVVIGAVVIGAVVSILL